MIRICISISIIVLVDDDVPRGFNNGSFKVVVALFIIKHANDSIIDKGSNIPPDDSY